jgi:8-amino-7-oxononanoate synthase
MFTLDQSPGRTAIINDKEYLFFSGYSYLGMSYVPEFVELVKEGIEKYGILHPSSRVSNTQLNIYEPMERLLSKLTNQEETILYSSGFLAGRAAIETLTIGKRNVFVAPNTHPAIQTTAQSLNDDWQTDFVRIVNEAVDESFVLLSDSVNPLTASITDLSFLNNINGNKQITCIIDDSHGIGLLGNKGEGISATLPTFKNVEYVLSYSLSKAFHINGGAISSSKKIATVLRQSPYYTASTSISPSHCYAFINGQSLYDRQRKKLVKNLNSMQQLLRGSPTVTFNNNLPIALLKDEVSQDYFNNENIVISSFPYPDPNGKTINRIVINALHTHEDLEKVAKLLQIK